MFDICTFQIFLAVDIWEKHRTKFSFC